MEVYKLRFLRLLPWFPPTIETVPDLVLWLPREALALLALESYFV